jgi:hypothetical protein
MKKTKKLITLLLMTILYGSCASAHVKQATYYRVWQGFKKEGLSQSNFIKELPQFMEDTVDLYKGRALNQYLVAIPPKGVPSFIPHEFALVALGSEKAYREIRKTDEGKQYSARHWDVFDRSNSSSSKFHNFYQDSVSNLENNHAYDMFGEALDWTKGYTTFYLGLRKKNLSKTTFMARLKGHVDLVKTNLEKYGMQAYIVIANEDYEVAFINWKSVEHMKKAFDSKEGKDIWKDASEILERVMFQPAVIYSEDQVKENSFISTL